jgi:hypothetical protein
MSETWELTDNPDRVTLTPITLRAALAALNWTPRILADKTDAWPGGLWADIQSFIDFGEALSVCQTGPIKRVLCKRLWFVPSGYGQGVVLKPETFGNAPGGGGYIQFTDKPKKPRPAP